MAKAKDQPSSAPPPGVPLEQTIGLIDYEGRGEPTYRNPNESRLWKRIWERVTLPSPP
jgi:hypothetical protein